LKAWHDECALFGIWDSDEASRIAYLGLYAQQHRGQEASGMVTLNENVQIEHKGLGLVADVFRESDLDRLKGRAAIGHCRYSTAGQNLLANAQPLTALMMTGPLAVAHNGNFVNADELRKQLKETGSIFQGTSDTECLLHLLAKNPSQDLVKCIKEEAPKVKGAYSLTILTHESLLAVRDPHGFRPLVLGKRKNADGEEATVIASETTAFDLIGAKFVREIKPGEIFWVDKSGEHSEFLAEIPKKLSQCVFEHVYFSRPDSVVFGKSVYESRKQMGVELAKEQPASADMVIAVPDSGIAAALGYSQESKIPFDMGIIRNHYIRRTFIEPQQSIRSLGVKIKLNPQTAILKGKRIVVVDDSLVRGTTSEKIINLIRLAGAKEVHVRIASPPTTGPCYYGVDTPQKEQLIAANQTLEQIRKFIGADTLGYLSVAGMMKGVNSSKQKYCAACFDGEYPV